MNAAILAVIVISAVWVYWDATEHNIGKVQGSGGLFNLSAGAWSVVTLLLWIVGLPAYLSKRGALIARARTQPVMVTRRWLKIAVLSVIGVLWIVATLA